MEGQLRCYTALWLCFLLSSPLNALGGGLSIWVKSIKLSEGVSHNKRLSLRFPFVEENLV